MTGKESPGGFFAAASPVEHWKARRDRRAGVFGVDYSGG